MVRYLSRLYSVIKSSHSTYMNRLLLLCIAVLALLAACTDDDDLLTGEADIYLTMDTLRFDTVFTSLGSATRAIKVVNRESRPVLLDEVRLEQAGQSFFRLNVDGTPGDAVTDVRVPARDSVYIFVEVTIDPDAPLSVSPFYVNDRLLVTTGSETRSVVLEAYGQNANYIPARNASRTVSLLSCDFQQEVWDDDKPYVVYGIIVVDSCELVLPEGAQVYFHGGLVVDGELAYNDGLLFVGDNGRLTVNGTLDNPVRIQGDRLESPFDEVPGQWAGIRFGVGSTGNSMDYAIIRQATVGVQVDSTADLTMTNTTIAHSAQVGVAGIHADLTAENCLIYDSGVVGAFFDHGGTYRLDHCTVDYDGGDGAAVRMSNFRCLNDLCTERIYNPLDFKTTNSIYYSRQRDAIALLEDTEAAFDYTFRSSVVRYNRLTDPDQPGSHPDFPDNCLGCINAESSDTLFVDANDYDYHLDSLSIAEGIGLPLPQLPLDLDGVVRDPIAPDAGAYEYID